MIVVIDVIGMIGYVLLGVYLVCVWKVVGEKWLNWVSGLLLLMFVGYVVLYCKVVY